MLDEVEQAVVSPLDVLEDEDERTLLGERLEEPPPRGERFLLQACRTIARLPHERTQMRQHPLRVVVDQPLDRARQLGLDLVVAVGLENLGLRFHHLGEGPIADALPVRQRASLTPIRKLSAPLDD